MGHRLGSVRVFAPALMLTLACRADTFEPHPGNATGIQPQFSITSTDTLYPVGDSWIRSAPKWQNNGASDSLRTKTTITSTDTNRTTLQFDQAAIAAKVGSGALVSAKLQLTVKASGWYTAGNDVAVHRLTTNWTEAGVNWNCAIDPYPLNTYYDCPGATWAMSGAGTRPYVLTPTDTVHMNGGYTGLVQFDVTADVAAFLAGTDNKGWLLKIIDEGREQRVSYWSREATAKPRLVLDVNQTPVPAQPPDSEPDDLYADSNIVVASSLVIRPHVRNTFNVLFESTANTAERQASIDLVQGTVVGGTRLSDGDGFYLVRVPGNNSDSALAASVTTLSARSSVASATPVTLVNNNVSYLLPNDGTGWKRSDWSLGDRVPDGANWSLEAMKAPQAWGCSTGDASVTIGIVDSRIASNSQVTDELPIASATRANALLTEPQHGIWVASVLGARGSNNDGMTGMMWNSSLRLYETAKFKSSGSVVRDSLNHIVIPTVHVARAIDAAVNAGAKIINISLAQEFATPANTPDSNEVFRDIKEVVQVILRMSPASRPLFVVSAGNRGPNLDARYSAYPALASEMAFPDNVLVVGGSARLGDTLTSFSQRGPLVQVAAPAEQVAVFNPNGAILPQSGVSLAAPAVAGIAGLLLSFDPRLTAQDLKDLIVEGAIAGKDSASGIPVANAYESLKLAAARPGAPLCGNPVWVDGTTIKVRRGASTSTLFDAGEALWGVQAFHGGHHLNWFGPSSTTGNSVKWTAAGWQPTSSLPPGLVMGGTEWSRQAVSHDEDKVVRVYSNSNDLNPSYTIDHGDINSSPGQPVRTIGPVSSAPNYFCLRSTVVYQGVVGPRECRDSVNTTAYDRLEPIVAYHPQGDTVLVAITWFSSHTVDHHEAACPSYHLPYEEALCWGVVRTDKADSTTVYKMQTSGGTLTRLWSQPGLIVQLGVADEGKGRVVSVRTDWSRTLASLVTSQFGACCSLGTPSLGNAKVEFRDNYASTPYLSISTTITDGVFMGDGTIAPRIGTTRKPPRVSREVRR